MAKTVTIYTEGKASSADYEVVNKVVDGLMVGPVITPIGGKKGAGSVIGVYETLAMRSDHYLFFRDRDFDAPVPDVPKLVPGKQQWLYYSYRTTIENYLISRASFVAALPSTLGVSVAEAGARYDEAARRIRFHEAVRHTLGELRVPVDFDSNTEKKSGRLPADLSEEACRATGLKAMSDEKAKTEKWTEENFLAIYQKWLDLFSTDGFYEKEKFLIYFQGKDFAKSLGQVLPGYPIKDMYARNLQNFDYTQFPDLVELRQMIANWLNA